MKMLRMAALGALALLTGCLFTPGKFDAAMDVRRDGSFTYRYTGEIAFATAQAMAAGNDVFVDQPFDPEEHMCWSEPTEDETTSEARECTPAEIEEARKEHQAQEVRRAEEQKKEKEAMKAMFGGMDPEDPATMDAFAERLQSYEGWKKVTHKGDGVFDVHFEAKGRIDQGFAFPLFPEVDFIVPFVQTARRDGNKVRVVAPAFVQGENMFDPTGMGRATQAEGKADNFVKAEGSFTLTTDAEILTNNTREGPSPGPGGTKVLKWTVGPLDKAKPEALLGL